MEQLLRDLNLAFTEVVKAKEYLHIYRSDDGTQNITRVYHPNDKKLIDLARNTENILFTRINELYGNAENTPSEIGELYADMQNIVKAQEYEAAAKKREEIIKIQTELSERNLTQNNFNTTFIKKISDNEIGYHYSPCHFLNGYLSEVFGVSFAI
jgi:DNA-dependent RNA polymerase auxiliary subunit epsilon